MTTVDGLTATRMLAIEAASVIDGDVVGGNLILTKHDGSQINAGSVIGPAGPTGPAAVDLSVLNSIPVLDVGQANQIRAGRQLTPVDFTNMGLSAPAGLWNLADLSDASGNGRALSNKGAVTFDVGINGIATTSARFLNSTAQVLYLPDTGAADPFRIKSGSFGCWYRTTKRGTAQGILAKDSSASRGYAIFLSFSPANVAAFYISTDGTTAPQLSGVSDIADDRWHQIIVTHDGTLARLYVDSFLEAVYPLPGAMFGSAGPINIGGQWGDASTATIQPTSGRVDEAFITADVLSDEEVRNLYCAKLPHTLGSAPSRISVNVHRYRRGAALVSGDFPTQPLRLHNFSAGSLGDAGSGGVALTNNGPAVSVGGVDGTSLNAFSFAGAQSLSATDAGLPTGVATRSFGCWLKTTQINVFAGVMAWGTLTTGESRLDLTNTNPSQIRSLSTSGTPDVITGPVIGDGAWHFVVVVEDNTAADGVKRKLYVDGRCVGVSTVLNAITLAGANHFRLGAQIDGSVPFVGQIDGAFICGYALTPEQIAVVYNKSAQDLGVSPKNAGDHVEAMRSADILATFDSLEMTARVDLKVAA